MTERSGASYRIKQTNWKPTPAGTNVSYPGGNVTASASSGSYLLESVHSRYAPGAHTARVEGGDDVYEAGPFRTQHRSQVAAASLANRVEAGTASKYHKETYR